MTSSAASPLSNSKRLAKAALEITALEVAIVVCCLTMLVCSAAWWCFENGYILYYGDAVSHLNISRSLIDSRTPGYDQLGTVWLPVLHVICLPFVSNDWLWSTGLAGTLPVAACFVIAGTCFYAVARHSYGDVTAAALALACFALNPNVLYLAAIPMTEVVFLAALSVAMLAVMRFRVTRQRRWIVLAVAASWVLSLTRYDGWFLIPFLAFWLAALAARKKLRLFTLVGAAVSLAPLYWIAHNWWETGNALDFYNGPYSPLAIQGFKTYPGYHDWVAAFHYYSKTGELCAGLPLILLGIAGALVAYRRGALQPILFLLLTPLFYVWSMHSSGGTPIHIPPLWPFTYYNSRYGIAFVPLCALAAGALALIVPPRWRKFSLLAVLFAIGPWLLHPSRQNWICWKESEVNSLDRRAWTVAGARFLQANYRTGQGILSSTGDVDGIYCRARIHLAETINIGNGPWWFLATKRPDLFHPCLWSVTQAADTLATSLARSRAPYRTVLSVKTSKYSPDLHILKRSAP